MLLPVPVEAPGTRVESAVKMTLTRPVGAPSTGKVATQSIEAPGARMATQPVEAPGARTDMQSQPASTGSLDMSAVDRSLTSKGTIADNTGVCDSEDEQNNKPNSPAVVREVLSDMDPVKDDKLNQEFSEEANYRETMRGVHSFMGWHQIPDFDSSPSSLDDNPFAGS